MCESAALRDCIFYGTSYTYTFRCDFGRMDKIRYNGKSEATTPDVRCDLDIEVRNRKSTKNVSNYTGKRDLPKRIKIKRQPDLSYSNLSAKLSIL